MPLAPESHQRLDARRRTSLHVLFAQITAVGEQPLDLAELCGQLLELLEHRSDLLFFVGCLRDLGAQHQEALGSHRRLSVVALIKAPARHRHDARVLIGEVGLLLAVDSTTGRFGRPPARLLAGPLFLLLSG